MLTVALFGLGNQREMRNINMITLRWSASQGSQRLFAAVSRRDMYPNIYHYFHIHGTQLTLVWGKDFVVARFKPHSFDK